MDLHLPNQMVVVIARSPRMGGLATGFDDADAKAVKGYIRAAVLPNKAGVAVYAEDTWAAFQAREAISVDWDFSAAETRSSDQIREELMAATRPTTSTARTGPRLKRWSMALTRCWNGPSTSRCWPMRLWSR
jgi:isoquinoline 1-oxidoreductase beta subunit